MGRIPDEVIEQIRDRVDVVELIGRFVSLKKSGRNYTGLCPFHNEKTASFNVNPDRQAFYCFGCQEGGNAIGFLMKIENLTFPEAARTLARDCGIEIPETDTGERGLGERLREANELAQLRYRAALAEPGSPGARYLASRGLDAETIERFGLGFAPKSWDFIERALRAKGISAETGERAGLLAPRDSGGHYDRLRERVIFPIRDVRGRVIGFGGRALGKDQEPKYLNTPESPIYRKREAFYGFPMALEPIRRLGRAVVVEGYFDLIALHRAGVEGVVATCGTALTPEHAHNLRRRGRDVVLLFDGDAAGQRAVDRALEVLLPQGLRVRAALLPAGDDPDSLLSREGADALRAVVDGAAPALETAIRRAVASGCSTPWEKADAVGAVAGLLALVPSAVERGELCAQVALVVGTERRHVEAAVRAAARGEAAPEAVPLAVRRSGPEQRWLRQLARSLVQHPHLAERIPRDEFSALVSPQPAAELIAALIDAAAGARRFDLEEVAAQLESGDLEFGEEARSLLRSLAVDDSAQEEAAAARTIDDTLGRLRKEHAKGISRAVTRKMREADADALALVPEKEALRRSAAEDVVHPPPMGSLP